MLSLREAYFLSVQGGMSWLVSPRFWTRNPRGFLERRDLELQHLSRERRDHVGKTSVLRCQTKETLLIAGYAELFPGHFFDTPVALPLARATGAAQAVLDAGLTGLPQRIPEGIRCQRGTLARFLKWARAAAPPHPP